ncbi:MAG: acyltransferase family protein [Hyphomicrobiales bacterium]|nr:acyltransferase family protein [Hyphomicrobiales bacterium]
MPGPTVPGRVAWVDYAKGFCIVMVVMMHSTLGVEAAAGQASWMNGLVEFARPFRMPDFFLLAGLFLAQVIDRDRRDYLDRKVAHFAYFYALWVTIQFALRAPGQIADGGLGGLALAYLLAYVEPFGTLWFIYLLPIFFVVAKLVRGVPWWVAFLILAGLEIAPVETGSTVIDEFAQRFVFFYIGYAMAATVFRLARWAQKRPAPALGGLALWAFVNATFVMTGWAVLPFVSLALGFAGAAAVVVASALLARLRLFDLLRYCGEHSLIVYLAFSLFMAATRIVLLRVGVISDLGLISLTVTAAGVTGPLILHLMVRGTPARYLFVRPQWARLEAGGLRLRAAA